MVKKNRVKIFDRFILAMKSCFFLFVLLLFAAGCSEFQATNKLNSVVDAPVRVVWCRQQACKEDIYAESNRYKLMGFCTEDGRGERVILGGVSNYHKPLFTADGRRIVFTNVQTKIIYVVNWAGNGLYELASGLADDIWLDPETGIEWVYYFPNAIKVPIPSTPLMRFQLDNPAIKEVVWSKTKVSADHAQLSMDGKFISIQYPWPQIGRLDASTDSIVPVGRGCWPAIAPDNSYLMWIFDGPHRNLVFHSFDGKERWVVNINHAPGIDEFEVYHPRWSNLDRFMAMSGPYRKGMKRDSKGVNIYVGRFDESLSKIQQWAQVTDNKLPDYYPDIWVEPAVGRYRSIDEEHLGYVKHVDHIKEKLVVKARLVEVTPTPTLDEIAPYTQTLVVYRYEVEEVVSGEFGKKHLLVAHWGIFEGKTIDVSTNVGDSVRLELEPYENRSELEGERLVMDLSDMSDALFYDLKEM